MMLLWEEPQGSERSHTGVAWRDANHQRNGVVLAPATDARSFPFDCDYFSHGLETIYALTSMSAISHISITRTWP